MLPFEEEKQEEKEEKQEKEEEEGRVSSGHLGLFSLFRHPILLLAVVFKQLTSFPELP